MLGFLSVFLITLGTGQLLTLLWRLSGLSLTGTIHWAGAGLGLLFIFSGGWLLPDSWWVLSWAFLSGPLVVIVLLWSGSILRSPPGPQALFEPDHPGHGSSQRLDIPHRDQPIPAILLKPRAGNLSEAAVCVVHGAGDHKTFFKSQLISALLTEGLTVLTVDLPGHGDYRACPLSYPDVLSTVPTALQFLRGELGFRNIGVVGISLGGAIAINSLAVQPEADLALALVVAGTPIRLQLDRNTFYRGLWRTIYGSPSLKVFQEMSAKQIWTMWQSGGYRSRHSTDELFDLLNPVENVRHLSLPILLVYSHRDSIAPLSHAQALQQAAQTADLIETNKASHVMLTLMPEVDRQIAAWLQRQLEIVPK